MTPRGRRRNDTGRYAILLALFLAGFVAVAGRLVWIQVVKADAYSRYAMAQRLRDIELPARRGTIYDREGEPLAVSVEARTIIAAPNRIRDKAGVARALAAALGGDEKAYLATLGEDSGYEYIERKADLDRAKPLEELKIDGLTFLEDSHRLYPSGELASQVLGFVGVDDTGLAGLERYYDDVLSGTPGVLLGEQDPLGRPIPGGIQKEIDPVPGRDIVLTIDKDIQYRAQIALAKAVEKAGAKSGTITVMSPKTGEIYAMAAAPGFNPNELDDVDMDSTRNRAITDVYEPGSTLKSLTAAGVVDKGYYTPASKFGLPPTITVGGRTIHESHGRGAVTWTLTEIVTNSSNVGTVKLGLKLGKKGLYDTLAGFGLAEKTGVDFPGEALGWLPPAEKWSASSIGNIPFGQGISLTALQLSRATSAVANKGEMVTPHFLLDVPGEEGSDPVWPKERSISATTAATVTGMLAKVVTEGTGKAARVPGYTVAGKTGTAQKARPGGGGYGGGRYVASFIGFLPAEDPQVLVCVTVDEPTRGYYGGAVAAPVFADVAGFAVEHLKVPPSSKARPKAKTAAGKPGAPAGVGQVSDDGARD